MTTTATVVACSDCGMFWYLGRERPACTDEGHTHNEFQVHVHLSTLTLPDGTEVSAASFDAGDPYARGRVPDYGLYFDRKWRPPWPHDWFDWPDFGVPSNVASLLSGLNLLLGRARSGERVEVGCLGGHGRTGTALACLAVLTGCPQAEAVAWVRANYCPSAVETAEQEALVLTLHV
jgi:Swiss Army Knife protein, DSP-PTPase phosphatase domain